MFKENRILFQNIEEPNSDELLMSQPEALDTRDPELTLRGLENEAERLKQVELRITTETANKQQTLADNNQERFSSILEGNRNNNLLRTDNRYNCERFAALLLNNQNVRLNPTESALIRNYLTAKIELTNYKVSSCEAYVPILEGRILELTLDFANNRRELEAKEEQIARVKLEILQQERAEITSNINDRELTEEELRRINKIDFETDELTIAIRNFESNRLREEAIRSTNGTYSQETNYTELEADFIAEKEENLAEKNLQVELTRLSITDTAFSDPNFNLESAENVFAQNHINDLGDRDNPDVGEEDYVNLGEHEYR